MSRARRELGATGLPVSPIGLGLAALGRPAYINLGRDRDLGEARSPEELEARTHRMLDAARSAGVRYLDAARSYGRAEEFLASWLSARDVPPGEVTVGSKWGYTYVGEWRMDAERHEVKDHSLGTLRGQYRESRRILGDHLRLYQVHSATLESGILEERSVLAELARIRGEEGVAVGLTVSGPRQGEVIRRALEIEVDGVRPFETVQATWNPLEPSAGEALAEAHRAGWGVIVKEAVANGRLTSRATGPEQELLAELARPRGVGVDAVAMAAVLTRPWAGVVLSGAVSEEQLRSNLAALEVRLTEDELGRLERLVEEPGDYWSRRASLSWD